MTTFRGSPKLLKGPIIGIDLINPLAGHVKMLEPRQFFFDGFWDQSRQPFPALGTSFPVVGVPVEGGWC